MDAISVGEPGGVSVNNMNPSSIRAKRDRTYHILLPVAFPAPIPYTVYVCAFDAEFPFLNHSIPSLKPVNFRHTGESSQHHLFHPERGCQGTLRK